MGYIEWTEIGQGRSLHEMIRAFRTTYLWNAGEVLSIKWEDWADGQGRVNGEFTLIDDPVTYHISCDYHGTWRIRWQPV